MDFFFIISLSQKYTVKNYYHRVDFRNNFYPSKYGDMVSTSISSVMTIGIAMFLLRLWIEKNRAHGKSDGHPNNDTENDKKN